MLKWFKCSKKEDSQDTKEPGFLTKVWLDAVSSTAGSGISSTKIVWLTVGLAACYSATVMSLAGASVYVFTGVANPVFWTACGGLWTVVTGFAVKTKRDQLVIRKGFHEINSSKAEGEERKGE